MRFSIWLFSAVFLPCCDSVSIVSPDPPPARTVIFRKALEREVAGVKDFSSNFNSGLAVTPDGRWLVSLGYSNGTVSLYDAATLDLVTGPFHYLRSANSDSAIVVQPHAVTVAPDGSFGVLAGRSGVIRFSLPSLDLLPSPQIPGMGPPRHIVRDRAGENYYVGGEGNNVAHLMASGEPAGLFETEGVTTGLSLTRDDRELLVLTENGRRLVVLTTPDLTFRLSIALPTEFEGRVVVPLRMGKRAIVMGGAPGGAETYVRGPLKALLVDLVTGEAGSTQVLSEGTIGGLFGDGNAWADVGHATAIVPTFAGVVTIDTNWGAVKVHSITELQNDQTPCCDIASYPSSDRVVIVNNDFLTNRGGSLIIYEVEERISSTSN